jgi:hypothetical protein
MLSEGVQRLILLDAAPAHSASIFVAAFKRHRCEPCAAHCSRFGAVVSFEVVCETDRALPKQPRAKNPRDRVGA